MLRGFAVALLETFFGRDRPNVPICRYGCRVVVILASVPAGFGPGPKVVVEERAARPVSYDFMSFLAPPGGASGAGAGRPLLLPCWTRPTPSRRRVACAEPQLPIIHPSRPPRLSSFEILPIIRPPGPLAYTRARGRPRAPSSDLFVVRHRSFKIFTAHFKGLAMA